MLHTLPGAAASLPCPAETQTRTLLLPLTTLQVDGEVVSLVVPCADMANHLAVPNAGYAFSAERDCFELTSLRVGFFYL